MKPITTLSMKLHRIAYTPFGIFGNLMCGADMLNTRELMFNHNDPANGPLMFGTYDLVRYGVSDEESKWLITGLTNRVMISIGGHDPIEQAPGSIIIGNRLGCIDGAWDVVKRDSANLIFSGWLKGLTTAHLVIVGES